MNYYTPFEVHGSTDDDEYCIRDTATHEFGHWIQLKDLVPAEDDSHCQDYERYTMFQSARMNYHDRESLECEEEWAALEVYGTSGD